MLWKEATLKKETDRAHGGFHNLLRKALTSLNDSQKKSNQIKTLVHHICESIILKLFIEKNSMVRQIGRQYLLKTVLLSSTE